MNILISSIIKPLYAFRTLSESKNNVRTGWLFTLGFSFLYSVTALLLALNHWEPNLEFPPFLPISSKSYYLYQSLFTIPVGIMGVGLNAILAYVLSNLFGSRVKIKDLWGAVSIASALPYFFFTWIPETFYHPWQEPGTILLNPGIEISRQIIAGLWCISLNIIAVKSVTKLKWLKSAITGIISATAMGFFMLIFYR